LVWEDVNFEEGIIFVHHGKGAKDRIVVLHDNLATALKNYRLLQRPTQTHVFEGKTPGIPITSRTIQWGFIRRTVLEHIANCRTPYLRRP